MFQYDVRDMASTVGCVYDAFKERFSVLSTQEALRLEAVSSMPLLPKATEAIVVTSSVVKMLGSAIKGLVLSDQTLLHIR